MIMITADL